MNKLKFALPLVVASFAALPLQAQADSGRLGGRNVVRSLISFDNGELKILSRTTSDFVGGGFNNDSKFGDRLRDFYDDHPLQGLAALDRLQDLRND